MQPVISLHYIQHLPLEGSTLSSGRWWLGATSSWDCTSGIVSCIQVTKTVCVCVCVRVCGYKARHECLQRALDRKCTCPGYGWIVELSPLRPVSGTDHTATPGHRVTPWTDTAAPPPLQTLGPGSAPRMWRESFCQVSAAPTITRPSKEPMTGSLENANNSSESETPSPVGTSVLLLALLVPFN